MEKKDHSKRGHHPLGPSNYPKWKLCPQFKNTGGTSQAALIGTQKHELFEREINLRNASLEK